MMKIGVWCQNIQSMKSMQYIAISKGISPKREKARVPVLLVVDRDINSKIAKAPQSKEKERGRSPNALTLPKVAFIPAIPQNAEGVRIDPPASLPRAPRQNPAATAAPEPLLEPWGARFSNSPPPITLAPVPYPRATLL